MVGETDVRNSIESLIAEYPEVLNEAQAKEFVAKAEDLPGVAKVMFSEPTTSAFGHKIRGGVTVLFNTYRNRRRFIDSYEVAWE